MFPTNFPRSYRQIKIHFARSMRVTCIADSYEESSLHESQCLIASKITLL